MMGLQPSDQVAAEPADSHVRRDHAMPEHGLTQREAPARNGLDLEITAPEILATSLKWRGFNIDPATAAQWAQLTWEPEAALPWHLQGFTPEQAEYADGTAFRNSFRRDPNNPAVRASTGDEWRDSGLPPEWICECLSHDIWSVEKARKLHADPNRSAYSLGLQKLLADMQRMHTAEPASTQ